MQFYTVLALAGVAYGAAAPTITAAVGPIGGGGGGTVASSIVAGGGGGHVGGPVAGGGSGSIESTALVGCYHYSLGPYHGSTCVTDNGPKPTATA